MHLHKQYCLLILIVQLCIIFIMQAYTSGLSFAQIGYSLKGLFSQAGTVINWFIAWLINDLELCPMYVDTPKNRHKQSTKTEHTKKKAASIHSNFLRTCYKHCTKSTDPWGINYCFLNQHLGQLSSERVLLYAQAITSAGSWSCSDHLILRGFSLAAARHETEGIVYFGMANYYSHPPHLPL